jgi:hypothetical protein
MTLEEIWLTFTGRPEQAVSASAKRAVRPDAPDRPAAADRSTASNDEKRIETLDWATTDSPSTLKERAEAAGRQATNAA